MSAFASIVRLVPKVVPPRVTAAAPKPAPKAAPRPPPAEDLAARQGMSVSTKVKAAGAAAVAALGGVWLGDALFGDDNDAPMLDVANAVRSLPENVRGPVRGVLMFVVGGLSGYVVYKVSATLTRKPVGSAAAGLVTAIGTGVLIRVTM